ncbi:MAG: response regulator [Candidatus Gastranaerophilaceae bacterium]
MQDIEIKLDKDFLNRFFKITGIEVSEDTEITLSLLKNNLEKIEDLSNKFQTLKKIVGDKMNPEKAKELNNEDDSRNVGPKKTIFIIDDLGVITYQLKTIFENAGYDTITSNEVFDAIEKFKRMKCDLVLMDLFIPTEREGLILLEKLKRLIAITQKPIKIGIITASTKKEHKQICKIKGADFFFEKVNNWHENILNVAKENLPVI